MATHGLIPEVTVSRRVDKVWLINHRDSQGCLMTYKEQESNNHLNRLKLVVKA
jgi:hypothetical protein